MVASPKIVAGVIEHHQDHHGPAKDIDGVDASRRRRRSRGAMRGVAWSGDAAGSIDMTGLLSAYPAGSVNGPLRGRRFRGDDHHPTIRPGLLIPNTQSA